MRHANGLVWLGCCIVLGAVWAPTASADRPLNFENDIEPIFTRHGCNTSSCHGKAEGQNGFKLSVFGFAPDADYQALLMEGRGRRVFPAAPDRSLLLQKASGAVPHGGGVRLTAEMPEAKTLRRWIAEGARYGNEDDPKVVRIALAPRQKTLSPASRQQLNVTAHWSDGRQEDVTRLATFQSNNENLASVNAQGEVATLGASGSVAVMATFLGHVDVFQAVIPVPQRLPSSPDQWPVVNPIDTLIYKKLEQLRIAPSPTCDDATFLRRAYLDVTGTLPTVDEATAFLGSKTPSAKRRAELVEQLLQREEYARLWSQKWSDLLRVNRQALGKKQAYAFYHWIFQSVRNNKPLDTMAAELLTSSGPLTKSPSGHFFKSTKTSSEMAATFSQVFLGVRIQCAQCHHHPWDRWGQEDYFGMQAVFAEVTFKKSARGDAIVSRPSPTATHPRTKAKVSPRALGANLPLAADRSQREQLAEWLVADDNPWFARNLANRIWAQLMGRGLVEPIDDFRLTNPPSHPELLEHLAAELRKNNYDAKHLIRHIMASSAYQRASEVTLNNRIDEFNYSRRPLKMLPAEVLLDAVSQFTGVPEKFDGVPHGSRAIELWDSHVPHYFLRLFGRPQRETACECERVSEPNVSQVLHLLNSPSIQEKLSHSRGNVRQTAAASADDGKVVEQLYLSALSRFPTPAEQQRGLRYIQNKSAEQPTSAVARQQAIEDLAWSLLNTIEFLMNH